MIVLRNSFYSKKESKLKDIPYKTHGLTAKSYLLPSLGELTGRRRGMEVADEMDEHGADELEILEKSPKEAKKMGQVVGGTVGLGTGIVAGNVVKNLSNKLPKTLVRNKGGIDIATNTVKTVMGNSPEAGETVSGKFLNKAVNKIENFYKDPKKHSKRIRKAGKIAGVSLAGLGLVSGISSGGSRAYKAAKEGNLKRLEEKNRNNKRK